MTETTSPETETETEPQDQAERDRIRQRTDATLFVGAGAGSGKTKSLVGRVLKLVLDDGIAMPRIATVTFTTKAGAELRDRLRADLEKVVRKTAQDDERKSRAEQALADLDLAAIGTLHSFAQRILSAHPIEAGLPPAVEVLDEVGSSIAFDDRWSRLQQQLLDDDAIAEALIVGMASGVTLRHLRQLVRLLGNDWDRLETHVLADRPGELTMPDLSPLDDAFREIAALRECCTDDGDKVNIKLGEFQQALAGVPRDADLRVLIEELAVVEKFQFGSGGSPANWGGRAPKEVREAAKEVQAGVARVRSGVVVQCLRHLTCWLADRVLADAQARQHSGQLEFHDLLVLSRDLLARSAQARETLHDTYERLLLDEFQDTDPIQIELAVRIAGGRHAAAPDWRDVDLPPGRLFVVGDAKQSIYRFRRASISTYLDAEAHIGERASLTTNFRSVPGVLDWVNDVFGRLIVQQKDAQPEYEPLIAHRSPGDELVGPAVTVLGATPHEGLRAAELRVKEADDVAGVIEQIMRDKWTVYDERKKIWREAQLSDIAVLLPSRPSMPMLESSLDAAGIRFRAEAMSLVYEAAEIRDLLLTARAIADPSDQLALVAALRSPLFGCGDDDLWRWRQAGGALRLPPRTLDPQHEGLQAGPVGAALAELDSLRKAASYLAPSQVLAKIVADRRMLELAAYQPRSDDAWRRIRFVVDQCRAWTEVSHGGLRGYLAWVAYQASEKARVSEAILPEEGVDAVRIMTVHAAKGLEFPIVILSGMTAEPRRQYGVRLLWNENEPGYAVSLSRDLREPDFDVLAAVDELMDDHERRRLLYVATTRACDHLIVSLHRDENNPAITSATMMFEAGAAEKGSPTVFTRDDRQAGSIDFSEPVSPPPDRKKWFAGIQAAQKTSRKPGALSASGLEGTDPEVVMGEAGRAKGHRDLDLPPWSKGRYGSAVGRAVHAVLQTINLATGAGLEEAAAAQAIAEGIPENEQVIADLARSAITSELVQRAAARPHWREVYAGALDDDGVLLEGFIDLLYRDDDGSLVVVDYKTDAVTTETLNEKVYSYRPQMKAYVTMLERATDARVSANLLFLTPSGALNVPML